MKRHKLRYLCTGEGVHCGQFHEQGKRKNNDSLRRRGKVRAFPPAPSEQVKPAMAEDGEWVMAEDGEWVVVNNGDVMEDLLDGTECEVCVGQ